MSYGPKISRQEMIDRTMCRPGYRWNETLQKCIGAYSVEKDPELPEPPKPQPQPNPDEAIKQEIASRETTGEVA